MNYQEALDALGLPEGSTTEEINTAVTQKNFDLEDKMSSAPTEALKVKFQIMLDKVSEAEKVLSQPKIAKSRSPLSETKMADLPGTAPASISAAEKLQPGETLSNGRYEIKEQIGEGGMGAVYHAFDTTRQEDMAIKVLLPSMISSQRAKERFMNEAKISSQLSHPSIVNVLDVQEDGDLTFLVMELLEGQDLRTLMDNRKLVRQEFDEKEAKELAVKLCDALQYAHKHTVHRDIKPENIWVTEEGDYKLMDFGIARVQSASQRTQTGAAMGTAYYMAPEQLKGTSNIDGRADQYALGILLYELLANEVPTGRFKSLNEVRTDLSKGFSNAVDKALEPYPEERFANMTEFGEALMKGVAKKKGKQQVQMPSIEIPWKKVAGIALSLTLIVGTYFAFTVYQEYKEEQIIKAEQIAQAQREKEQRERLRVEREIQAKKDAIVQAKADAIARKNAKARAKAKAKARVKAEEAARVRAIAQAKARAEAKVIARARAEAKKIADLAPVIDRTTGLMWQKCSLGLSGSICTNGVASKFLWNEATAAGQNNTDFGYSDWRLPTKKELLTLIVQGQYPTINKSLFPNTRDGGYWSSSNGDSKHGGTGNLPKFAYYITFAEGRDYISDKKVPYVDKRGFFVRLVRRSN